MLMKKDPTLNLSHPPLFIAGLVPDHAISCLANRSLVEFKFGEFGELALFHKLLFVNNYGYLIISN